MSYRYEGLATVAVMTVHKGLPPAERITLDCPVRLSNAGPGLSRLELDRYLQGPKDANTLRVLLPGGRVVQGRIIDGCNEPAGGWLLIDVEQDLSLAPPANGSGWKWE
jgi:hypothetical protein